jgi:hypothetical protein
MKTTQFLKVMILSAGLFVVLLLAPKVSNGQTAGGSVVLAKCNSYVQFTVTSSCGDVEIKNICLKQKDQSRVDISLGSTKESFQIPYGQSITKGHFTEANTIKIVNIEKGTSGTQCGSRGPGDSDVRVYIPENATNIVSGGLTTATSCDVCKASFQ